MKCFLPILVFPALSSFQQAIISTIKKQPLDLRAEIDFKPALHEEELDARLLREFEANQNKQLKNVMTKPVAAKDYLSFFAGSQSWTKIRPSIPALRKNASALVPRA